MYFTSLDSLNPFKGGMGDICISFKLVWRRGIPLALFDQYFMKLIQTHFNLESDYPGKSGRVAEATREELIVQHRLKWDSFGDIEPLIIGQPKV